jgi:hypothetical protein
MAHYTGIYNEFCYLKIIEHYMLQDSCHHEKAVRIYTLHVYTSTPPPPPNEGRLAPPLTMIEILCMCRNVRAVPCQCSKLYTGSVQTAEILRFHVSNRH